MAVGHTHGVRPGGIVGAITAEGGLNGKDLGRIDIYDTFSTVEIAGQLSPAAFGRISAAKVSGQSLRIELDSGEYDGRRAGRAGARRRTARAGPVRAATTTVVARASQLRALSRPRRSTAECARRTADAAPAIGPATRRGPSRRVSCRPAGMMAQSVAAIRRPGRRSTALQPGRSARGGASVDMT